MNTHRAEAWHCAGGSGDAIELSDDRRLLVLVIDDAILRGRACQIDGLFAIVLHLDGHSRVLVALS